MKFKYMWRNECSADVEFDPIRGKVTVVNHTDDIIKRPFGVLTTVTLADLEEFFESRCFPRSRENCKQLLKDLNVCAYDPLSIVLVTHGKQLEDYAWILFEGETLDYERDIKLRD